MMLPNGDRAVVDIRKLRDYCLSPTHPVGKHKARVFSSVLGMGLDHAEQLREILLEAARTNEAEAGRQDQYGQRYVVECLVAGPRGSARILSVWIVLATEDFPRLVTCYVL